MALAVELACRDTRFLRLDTTLDRRRLLAGELIASDALAPLALLIKWGFSEATLHNDNEEIEQVNRGLRTRVTY